MRSAPLLMCLVDAELARHELVAAQDAARALRDTAATAGRAHLRALAALATARTHAAVGDAGPAVAEIETGLAALNNGDWPLIAADLRLELAGLLKDEDRVTALSEARMALATFTAAGAARMHDAQALLHALGDSLPPVEPAAVARLTARERQVLRLLAGGASNPGIARALVISTKTAEHHVSNILRKLQLTGRSEAAVYAATLADPRQR